MLVQTKEQFQNALHNLNQAARIAVDVETQWIKEGQYPKLIGMSLYAKNEKKGDYIGYYLPFRHQHNKKIFPTSNLPINWLKRDVQQLLNTPKELIFHHAKFDRKVLALEGVKLKGNFFCTLILAHLTNENRLNKSLDRLASEYLSRDKKEESKQLKELAKSCGGWHKIPPEAMEIYAVQDTELTYHLFFKLWQELKDQQLTHLWPIEMEFCTVLQKMEMTGIAIDIDLCKKYAYEANAVMKEVETDLGFSISKPSELARKLFSPPPKGLGLPVGKMTKNKLNPPIVLPNGKILTNVPAMDIEFLQCYRHLPLVEKVIQYRDSAKASSTWFESFLRHVHADGRLHPNFKQHVTTTGRLSCETPNMQQLPRAEGKMTAKSKVKSILRAASGKCLIGFDYSQMEFRLAACYAKENTILEEFNSNPKADFHQLIANQLNISRDKGKILDFTILYGGGQVKIGQQLGYDIKIDKNGKMTCPEGASLLNKFWGAYPGMAEAIKRAQRAAEARGWVPLWTGHRRRFKFSSEYHKAFNSIIQGGAAKIVQYSMLFINRSKYAPSMVCQVHDELWFELGKETLEEDIQNIKAILEWPGNHFDCPFPVETKLIYTGE